MTDWNQIPEDKLYPTLEQFLKARERISVLEERLDQMYELQDQLCDQLALEAQRRVDRDGQITELFRQIGILERQLANLTRVPGFFSSY